MAEYRDQNELLNILNNKYESIADINSIIIDMKPADVIERSEYEKLKQKNIELEIEYDDVMKMNALRVTEYKQLHSKIEKAIEEMRCYLTTIPSNKEWINGIEHGIEILKRNLEDIDF